MNKYKNKIYLSNKLSADPSFIGGMSSVLDIGATLQEYNASETENEADARAIQNDWKAIGEDIKVSIINYEQKTQELPNQPKTAPASV